MSWNVQKGTEMSWQITLPFEVWHALNRENKLEKSLHAFNKALVLVKANQYTPQPFHRGDSGVYIFIQTGWDSMNSMELRSVFDRARAQLRAIDTTDIPALQGAGVFMTIFGTRNRAAQGTFSLRRPGQEDGVYPSFLTGNAPVTPTAVCN